MTKFICETKNLSKKYKDFYALKNVNLTIPKGEIYGLEKTRNTLITTERGNADMFYFLLICSTSKIAISAPPLSEIIQFFL